MACPPDFATDTANTDCGGGLSGETNANRCGLGTFGRFLVVSDDGGTLFISDASNHRVLAFDVANISDGEPAINVFGQPTFDDGYDPLDISCLSSESVSSQLDDGAEKPKTLFSTAPRTTKRSEPNVAASLTKHMSAECDAHVRAQSFSDFGVRLGYAKTNRPTRTHGYLQ